MGVHLLDKLYLISDTRETINQGGEDERYLDDLSKYYYFNKQCSCIAAGNTTAASYLLTRLSTHIMPEDGIDKLEFILKSEGEHIISDYVNFTKHHGGQIALIIAGFNPGKIGKSFSAASIGNAMSGALVEAGDGSMMEQSIDPRITEAIMNKAISGRFQGSDMVEVKTYNSRMISVKIDIKSNNFTIKDVECYQSVTFYPNRDGNIQIKLPDSIISYLEFRRRDNPFADDVLYEDCQKLMSFVNDQVTTKILPTVGGHYFPIIQTVLGTVFPTGNLGTIRNGILVYLGSVYVSSEGKLSYTYSNGKEGVFRQLKNIQDITGDSFM
jgi:hypothetical protein